MRSIEPGTSRFRVRSFGPSRNDGKTWNRPYIATGIADCDLIACSLTADSPGRSCRAPGPGPSARRCRSSPCPWPRHP
ncbi:hypothetical protein CVM73_17305 [Bradyrhizobium forestalis]|uniref:Uncharacterized protein n=1 Tax=Bradyrhizobium forestalis TaxID=1419263 RepID=A0A2M8R7P0_9BRAD|nr:hypothetical protein CVM73_17305 [Bradyrhizobium forestalis]